MRHEHAHHDLYLAVGADVTRRYTNPVYDSRFLHVRTLPRQIGAHGDLDLLTHTLLGYLDSAFVDHLIFHRGMTMRRLEAGWRDLVDRLVATRSPGGPGDDAAEDEVGHPSEQE